MASGRRKGQSEINLGAGHIAGMFLAVLVLCGIFFTLGYVLGRGSSPGKESGASAGSAAIHADGNTTGGSGSTVGSGWDFFPKKSTSNGLAASRIPPLTPQPAAGAQPTSGPISMAARPVGVHVEKRPPLLGGGQTGYLLQVAAMENRGDALALAGFLKQKGYPAFAWGPAADRLYRVQVGPYPNSKTAGDVRIDLEKQGFQSILKR